jgi:hypothetical protein
MSVDDIIEEFYNRHEKITSSGLGAMVEAQLYGHLSSLLEGTQEQELIKSKTPQGLLELRMLAKMQRTFSPQEKASALKKFVPAGEGKNPWELLLELKKNVDQQTSDSWKADCPEALIRNVYTLASFVDLVFSPRGGQVKGWFMEEWLSEATGGRVISTEENKLQPELGTADFITGNGHLWSVKTVQESSILGSRTDFLYGMGYASFVKEGDKENIYFIERTDVLPENIKPINYIFIRPDYKAYSLKVYNIDSHQIAEMIIKEAAILKWDPDQVEDFKNRAIAKGTQYEDESGQKTSVFNIENVNFEKDILVFSAGKLKGSLGGAAGYTSGTKNQIDIKFDFDKTIKFANDEANVMFAAFKNIAEQFNSLHDVLSSFYAEPSPENKEESVTAANEVAVTVDNFVDLCRNPSDG